MFAPFSLRALVENFRLAGGLQVSSPPTQVLNDTFTTVSTYITRLVDPIAVVPDDNDVSLDRQPQADRSRGRIAWYADEDIPLRSVIHYNGQEYEVTESYDYTRQSGVAWGRAERIE